MSNREDGSEGSARISAAAAVAHAVKAYQQHPGADDDAIHAALTAQGLSEILADRLIQLVPIAFCRALLTPQGVQFPDCYSVMGPRGKHLGNFPLSEEPIFTEALAAAREEVQAGRGGPAYLAIAARSGGYQAVMKLVGEGSNPSGIICSPPVLMTDRSEWQRDVFAPEPPRKPWWQRLRG